jgi:hypothetical protein
MLMKATRPKLVVLGAALHAMRDTQSADTFNRLADAAGVVEIPPNFSSLEAGEAGRQILDRVQAVLAPSGKPAQA